VTFAGSCETRAFLVIRPIKLPLLRSHFTGYRCVDQIPAYRVRASETRNGHESRRGINTSSTTQKWSFRQCVTDCRKDWHASRDDPRRHAKVQQRCHNHFKRVACCRYDSLINWRGLVVRFTTNMPLPPRNLGIHRPGPHQDPAVASALCVPLVYLYEIPPTDTGVERPTRKRRNFLERTQLYAVLLVGVAAAVAVRLERPAYDERQLPANMSAGVHSWEGKASAHLPFDCGRRLRRLCPSSDALVV
jgi:hypothetical protein